MSRPRQDEELKAITACVEALGKLDDGQQARAMSYLGDRFTMPNIWDGIRVERTEPDPDPDDRAPVPVELGNEPDGVVG